MSTAIYIFAVVGFLGRLVYTGLAMRSRAAVWILTLLGAGLYVALFLAGFSPAVPATRFVMAYGTPALAAVCAAMFAAGYAVPSWLRAAAHQRRLGQSAAFLTGVLTALLIVDLNRTVGRMSLLWPFLNPEMCFVGGVMAYLIFNARIFEMEDDPGPERERRVKG